MKLLGIEFHGFKSFPDSQDIRFHDGITAIVGPNGCGKSNVADALRWVLGEQRPSAIRGSRMEEAIFQGTDRRKPIQRAEVILNLSNEDGVLPVPYTEVQINRTVHRGGEGEYRLNGDVCRLRDIQDLCRDTGLGSNTYAIIEGRMVDAILSERAEERREMFEEAAGIGRYKERRRVASRRLDEADADLNRIDDLIGEVQTKVRSLAQQRGRARRYRELRERKLAVELAVAGARLRRLEDRRREIELELGRLDEARSGAAADHRSAEAEYEKLKTRLASLDRERAETGRKLMAVRDRLAERERERLLEEERARHARARLERNEAEQEELDARRAALTEGMERYRTEEEERRTALEEVRETLKARESELSEVAERRRELESEAEAAEAELRERRERRARTLAALETARAQAEEAGRRLGDLESRAEAAAQAVASAEREVGAARESAESAERRCAELESRLEEARSELSDLQARRDRLRGEHAGLVERVRALEARIETLEALTSGDQGLNPAVRAALERRDGLGILGVLGHALDVDDAYAEGVEAYLGAYLEALVVQDEAAARRVRDWFLTEYDGPGGLILLPGDRAPETGARLPDGVRASEVARGWAARLLSGVRLGDRPPSSPGDGAWVGRRESVDARGIHRLGQPESGGGVLARRAELEAAREDRAEVDERVRGLASALEKLDARLREQQAELAELESDRRSAEEERSRLAARAEAADERHAGLQEERASLSETIERVRSEREDALERASRAEDALADLRPASDTEPPADDELEALRSEWERLKETVSQLRLDEALAAAALDRAERDLKAQRDALASADRRDRELEAERTGLEGSLAESRDAVEAAAEELEASFRERDELDRRASELEEQAESLGRRVSQLEGILKKAQQREREQAERRHELELERSRLEAELSRTRERLEDEWGRPYDELAEEVDPAEGELDELKEEVGQLAERLARIGPVNMLAEQEYEEESERLEFIEAQREDLVAARDDLRATIRDINDTASKALIETVEQIRENFQYTFSTLFEGGQCDVWFEEPDDPLDSPIEISASPGGKKTQRIHLLSGGERALTALALLFAIYLVKPSPFCLLDEVDAPLDETNIRRFVAMLNQFKSDVQFIVITHNPVTIEAADWIYGVTMEEPGVSKIVGVEFSEFVDDAEDAEGAVA